MVLSQIFHSECELVMAALPSAREIIMLTQRFEFEMGFILIHYTDGGRSAILSILGGQVVVILSGLENTEIHSLTRSTHTTTCLGLAACRAGYDCFRRL